jgi:hypothetical protein
MSRHIRNGPPSEAEAEKLLDGLRRMLLSPSVEKVDVEARMGVETFGEPGATFWSHRSNGTYTVHIEINGGARDSGGG